MKTFHVADLSLRGDLIAIAEYGYGELEQIPGAADLIVELATQLYRTPEGFELPLMHTRSGLSYRWSATAPTAGIATLRNAGELASLGLLASGLNRDADKATLQAFQTHLLQKLRDTEFEPAFALLGLEQRPLVVSVPFLVPTDRAEQLIVALADRCFAAAYFRYLNLA
jgi:hypothetical protein